VFIISIIIAAVTGISPLSSEPGGPDASPERGASPGEQGAGGGEREASEDLTERIKAENERLREIQTCKICMERPVNTTLLPCGHLVSCDSCARRLAKCPICRTRIQVKNVQHFNAIAMLLFSWKRRPLCTSTHFLFIL